MPAKTQATLLNGATSTGAGTGIDALEYNCFAFYINASSVTTGGTVKIQTLSPAGDWVDLSETAVTADGDTQVTKDGAFLQVRANVTARTDGTYTVTMEAKEGQINETAAAEEESGDGAPTTDLVSLWTLNEASGTREDSHGSNDLTDGNTVGQGTGKVGNSADFESANSERLYVLDANQTGLSFTGDFSFTGWIKRESDSGTAEMVLTKWSNWTQDTLSEYYLAVESDDELALYVSSNGSSFSTVDASTFGALSTGTWYFFFCYYDHSESEIGISINNGTVDTASFTGPLNNSTSRFSLGALYDDWASSWLFHFDGEIDQVRVYSRKLDASEVTTLYNSGSGL